MSVVATSVFLLFALIVLGFILGKRNIIHKESIPDFSTLVLKVTMPVTVFCSIIDQDRSQLFATESRPLSRSSCYTYALS